eukprot:7201251-Prymnesium_polylepis.1
MHRRDMIKLGDLGLSKYDHAVTSDKKHTVCGSPLYLAPEVHMGRDYSKKVDVWGIGCTLFEIMMLEHAFQVRRVGGSRTIPSDCVLWLGVRRIGSVSWMLSLMSNLCRRIGLQQRAGSPKHHLG